MFSPKTHTAIDVKIKPYHSQVVLVTLAISSLVPLGLSVYLLVIGIEYWWIFFTLTVVMLTVVSALWIKSQRSIDYTNAHPTTLSLPNELTLVTDSRVFNHKEATKNLANTMIEIMDRQRLPVPDGLVDASHNPIPNSFEDAQAKVDELNFKIEQEALSLLSSVHVADNNTFPQNAQISAPQTSEKSS